MWFHNRKKEFGFDFGHVGGIKLSADDNVGDLLLGRVRQEYILDPDLRGILSSAVLDADKMIPYQDQDLFLITSVVYSENFEFVDKRVRKVCNLSPSSLSMTFRVRFDFQIINQTVSCLSGWLVQG